MQCGNTLCSCNSTHYIPVHLWYVYVHCKTKCTFLIHAHLCMAYDRQVRYMLCTWTYDMYICYMCSSHMCACAMSDLHMCCRLVLGRTSSPGQREGGSAGPWLLGHCLSFSTPISGQFSGSPEDPAVLLICRTAAMQGDDKVAIDPEAPRPRWAIETPMC